MNIFLQSMFRHALTTAGGAIVADGVLSASDWQTVSGAIAILAGLLWSWIEKRRR